MKRKLVIEDFGKIGHCELELKPMMMFVGDNNSGKSYLMSLLWGLSTYRRKLLVTITPEVMETPLYKECVHYLTQTIDSIEMDSVMPEEWCNKFWALLNCCIEQNKNSFVSDIFNKEMTIGKLELSFVGRNDLPISFSKEKFISTNSLKEDETETNMILRISINKQRFLGLILDSLLNIEKYIEYILIMLIQYWENFFLRQTEVAFLPSSRTGFVLSKNLLTNNMYENSFNRFPNMVREEDSSYFTKPVVSFLKLLNVIGVGESKNQNMKELAEFIEQEILYGKVEVRKPMGTSFLYKPEGQEDAYQMYLTSAVVTEITPLYLLFKYYDGMSRIFIEEPEMCMHPQLQTAIARILIRMYNAGISVMATTHSDIIIQHINNMIRIHKSSNRQELMDKFQLEKQDLISIENIGVYQFTCHKDGLSEIVELEAGELGFETPTFSNAFEKMLEVTYEI